MPLFREWGIGNTGLAAIWKIEEPESFFREQTGLDSAIKSDTRRIEHLAGRFLLKQIKKDFPLHLIHKNEHDKPILPLNEVHFSISHSWPYIAAIIDSEKSVGIDIQTWNPAIHKIAYKFLSDDEQMMVGDDTRMLTLAWCAKETVYKWHGKRGVEFIEQLPIIKFDNSNCDNTNIFINLNNIPQIVFIENIINIDFACTFINSVQNLAIS